MTMCLFCTGINYIWGLKNYFTTKSIIHPAFNHNTREITYVAYVHLIHERETNATLFIPAIFSFWLQQNREDSLCGFICKLVCVIMRCCDTKINLFVTSSPSKWLAHFKIRPWFTTPTNTRRHHPVLICREHAGPNCCYLHRLQNQT